MKRTDPLLDDIKQIRDRARQHIERGAVVDNYGADREFVLQLLNEALATELVCSLRYLRHYHTVSGIHAQPIASEFLEHAHDEQHHAEKIAERIVQLDGDPDYNPEGLLSRSHADYVEGDDLVDMVREDLVAERIAIESYGAIVRYLGDRDPTSRRLIEDILAKEEEHAHDLANILADLAPDRVDEDVRPDIVHEAAAGHAAHEAADWGHSKQLDPSPPASSASGDETRPSGIASEDEAAPLPRDVGYGVSHGYDEGHGGPSGPGDAPAFEQHPPSPHP